MCSVQPRCRRRPCGAAAAEKTARLAQALAWCCRFVTFSRSFVTHGDGVWKDFFLIIDKYQVVYNCLKQPIQACKLSVSRFNNLKYCEEWEVIVIIVPIEVEVHSTLKFFHRLNQNHILKTPAPINNILRGQLRRGAGLQELTGNFHE